jgi:hypothetical protein
MKAGVILKVQKVLVKNAPTILAVMGAVGTIAAVCMSSDASLKARQAIDAEEFKRNNEDICDKYLPKDTPDNASVAEMTDIIKSNGIDEYELDDIVMYSNESKLSKADKLMIYAKAYAPTAVMTVASIVCIFGSNHINKKRIASLAGAYLMSETALKEYKEKAKEVVGVKKAQEISDEIVQDRMNSNPASKAEIANTPGSQSNIPTLSLWYDIYSDRYFYSNAEMIRKAELEAQKLLDKNHFVNVNDIYAILGVKEIPLGEYIGWEKKHPEDDVEVRLIIGSALDDADVPMGTMDMNVNVRPSDLWCGEI